MCSISRQHILDDFLKKQWMNPSMSDVQLLCGNQIFLVHKLILAAYSKTLRKTLSTQDGCESKCIKLNLADTNISPELLAITLKYLYTGEFDQDIQSCQRLKMAAEVLEIPFLESVAREIINEDKTGAINKDRARDKCMIDPAEDRASSILPKVCKEEDSSVEMSISSISQGSSRLDTHLINDGFGLGTSNRQYNMATIHQPPVETIMINQEPVDIVLTKQEPEDQINPNQTHHSHETGKDRKAAASLQKSRQCEICSRVFSTKCNLDRHIRYKHKKGQKTFPCTSGDCTARFRDRYDMRRHIRGHHDLIKLQCSKCDKEFKSEVGLKCHEMEHDGIYRFLCPHCSKGFNYRGDFNSHILKHSGIRPYECELCSKAFYSRSNLAGHKLTCKITERTFVCEQCGKTFITQKSLKDHLDSVHAEPRHVCRSCGKTFKYRGTMSKHRKLCAP